MALIKCIECETDISEQATTCPSCGAPVSHNHRNEELSALDIFLNSYSLSFFTYSGGFLGAIYGVATYIVTASPGNESSLWAFAWILIGAFIGGTIRFIFFGMPAIGFGLISAGGYLGKVFGILLIIIFGLAVYFLYYIFSDI